MTQHNKPEARQQEEPEQPAENDEQVDEEDDKLDKAIEMTFPASDPVSI